MILIPEPPVNVSQPAPLDTRQSVLLLVIAGLAGLLVLSPGLLTRTLALDGLIYSNIAHLLQSGEGTFWQLPFYETHLEQFIDQPPLGVWLLSQFMHLVGAWPAGLAAVQLLHGILYVGLLIGIRAAIRSGQDTTSPALAVALLLTMPVFAQKFPGGYLDTWLMLTSLAAVACFFAARRHHTTTHKRAAINPHVWSVLAGLLVTIGLFIKGPVALFPLATPLAIWWLDERFWPAFKSGCTALAVALGVCAATFILWEDARTWAAHWTELQLLASVTGARPAEHGRAWLLGELAWQLGPALVLLMVACRRLDPTRLSLVWAWLAVCATAPLLVSARQYSHYLLPALPFWALAIASIAGPPRQGLAHLITLLMRPRVAGLTITGLLGAIAIAVAMLHGSPGRDHSKIQDAQQIASRVTSAPWYCDEAATLKTAAYAYHLARLRGHRGVPKRSSGPTRQDDAWFVCSAAPAPDARPVLVLSETRLWRRDSREQHPIMED